MAALSINDRGGFGRIEVRDVPVPDFVTDVSGTYTYSGKVLLTYKTAEDPRENEWINLAVQNDDGSGFHRVFSGTITPAPRANGLRYMVFGDNQRILMGDYVMECRPDIDACEDAKVVPLVYPAWLNEAKDIWLRWSEVIIAPDNVHMCWSALSSGTAGVFIGALRRACDAYHLDNVKRVSTVQASREDPEHEGCVLPLPMRGGEVKQFVRGGAALSLVGAGRGVADSVLQALDSEDVTPITQTPGYDETTILSPDERLGIVMSTRFSPRTGCAIFGLIPRSGNMTTKAGVIMPVYLYAVSGVRAFRDGNIGPVLIDIRKSMRPLSGPTSARRRCCPSRPRQTESPKLRIRFIRRRHAPRGGHARVDCRRSLPAGPAVLFWGEHLHLASPLPQ